MIRTFNFQESCKILQNNLSSFKFEDMQKRWCIVLSSDKTKFLMIECVYGEISLFTDSSHIELQQGDSVMCDKVPTPLIHNFGLIVCQMGTIEKPKNSSI